MEYLQCTVYLISLGVMLFKKEVENGFIFCAQYLENLFWKLNFFYLAFKE